MAKTTRKSESVSAGITQLQYEEALAKYAANDARKCGLEAEMDEQMTAIREEYDADLSLIVGEQGMLAAVIKGYCVNNRESLFTDKKSIDTLYGKVGFRKSPPALKTLPKVTWEMVVENLEALLPDYVRTVKEADKEKLIADREDEKISKLLPALGVKVQHDEKFFIELKKEEAAV